MKNAENLETPLDECLKADLITLVCSARAILQNYPSTSPGQLKLVHEWLEDSKRTLKEQTEKFKKSKP